MLLSSDGIHVAYIQNGGNPTFFVSYFYLFFTFYLSPKHAFQSAALITIYNVLALGLSLLLFLKIYRNWLFHECFLKLCRNNLRSLTTFISNRWLLEVLHASHRCTFSVWTLCSVSQFKTVAIKL